MKIDNINMEDLKTIEFNYDNLDLLKIIKYFIGVVLNDVDYMNDTMYGGNEEQQELDLGNNYIIKREDLESLYSILDTIYDVVNYNKKEDNNE